MFPNPQQRIKLMIVNDRIAAVLAVLVGISGGVCLADAMRAQQVKPPAAYILAEVEKDPTKPQDPVALQKYKDETPKSIAAFGGRYVVVGGKPQTLEGEAPKGYIIIIGFDSVEKARAWYDSPAYDAIKPIRQNSTKSRLLLLEGVAAPQ
jgi:uncharacterized protein (DUF1330 family)